MTAMGTLLLTARRNFLTLLCWTLLGGAAGGVLTLVAPVEYQAAARVLIVAPYWNDSTAIADPNYGDGALAYGDEFTQQRVASYARLLSTPFVTRPVTQRLGLGISERDLTRKVDSHVISDTVIMEIKATDRSPTTAALIADEVARQLISSIKEMERPPFSRVSPVQPLLVQPADVPTRPISPRMVLYTGSGLLFGFLTGLTYVWIRDGRTLAQLIGPDGNIENVLGMLSGEPSADLVDADARFTELQISKLRGMDWAPVFFVAPRTTSVVFSAVRRIAAAMSEAGRRPIVVVADSKMGAAATGQPGLLDVIAGATSLERAIVFDEIGKFDWLPVGDPAEFGAPLPAAAVAAVLDQLAITWDVVVVAPAVLESVSTIDLAEAASTTVLVTALPGTSQTEVREAERLLKVGRGRYLGRVVVSTAASANQALADRM